MFTITRQIGVDYGHRVMSHGSKCKNIHGHRGTIEVTCEAASLHQLGEQQDMVLDFGFLKEIMISVIDASIDHGFISSISDKMVLKMFSPGISGSEYARWVNKIRDDIKSDGFCLTKDTMGECKLYIVDFIPTSERLAEHFFHRLKKPVHQRSQGLAKIVNLRFWETPNCFSDFPGLICGKDVTL